MKPHFSLTYSAIAQVILICGCEAWVFYSIKQFVEVGFGEQSSGSLPYILTYFTLFLFSQVFYLILVIDGVFHKNTMQMLAAAMFNLCIFAYAGIQIYQINNLASCLITDGTGNHDENCPKPVLYQIPAAQEYLRLVRPILYVIVGLMAVFNIITAYFTQRVYVEYGWLIFQVQGAGLFKRKLLRRYHMFILLLKMNIYFALGILLQVGTAIYYQQLVSQNNKNSTNGRISSGSWVTASFLIPEFIIMAVSSILYYVIGYLSVRRSSKRLMIFFLVLMTIIAITVTLGMVMVLATDIFKLSRLWLTCFSVVQLILIIFTFIVAIQCMLSFKFGFKDVINPSEAIRKALRRERQTSSSISQIHNIHHPQQQYNDHRSSYRDSVSVDQFQNLGPRHEPVLV